MSVVASGPVKYRGRCKRCAASEIEAGTRVVFEYWSKRGERHMQMEAVPEDVSTDSDGVTITARRSDGQKLLVTGEGRLLSAGSNYPDNGPVTEYTVRWSREE